MEVLNAYQSVYPRARSILASLKGQANYIPQASFLDKLASRTRNAWDKLKMPYDRFLFNQMLCELGIVGTILQKTGKYIESEFEYILPDRLILNYDEECVIHPMFYKFFRIRAIGDMVVYPVGPDALDFD
jgi:hypothetical protein